MKANRSLALAILIGLGLSGAAIARSSDPMDQNSATDPAMTGKVPPPPPPEAPLPLAPDMPTPPPPPEAPPVPPQPNMPMAPMSPTPRAMADTQSTGSTTIPTRGGPTTINAYQGTIDRSAYKIDFEAMDRNHNGSISRSEAKANANLSREFRVVDANHDGKLSPNELANWK